MGFSISSLSRTEIRRVKPLAKSQPPRRYQPAPSYNYKWTEIHYEASRGNLDKLRALLLTLELLLSLCSATPDKEQINRKDYYGKTPLYWAAYKGQRSSVELLLKCGADVNSQCKHGGTPLHAAVGLFPDCVLVLIQHGADVDLPDIWGVTPMYLAACSGQIACIHLLVQAGAKVNYKNKTGEAPKQLSSRPTLLKWLEELVREPRSLQQQCRRAVHHALGPARIPALFSLPIPFSLRAYLMFQDLHVPDTVGQNPTDDHWTSEQSVLAVA
ncbi:serine/threonine-protein phosphatase 6 regulatory ankyrin repeat subunit A-like isoform X2 [Anguilla rostrata]|uniref:serine/threonine-protein phosphatase 6 regulatory ankyrin repeat subunit A-like isoform X2 n=1 Tax=Anguilla rostrata TaxID=7938 RepID=UPI0030CAEA05